MVNNWAYQLFVNHDSTPTVGLDSELFSFTGHVPTFLHTTTVLESGTFTCSLTILISN
jgi:hypothetical protein